MGAEPSGDERKRICAGVFGRGAETYDQIGRPYFAELGAKLVEMAGISEGDSVLDVATGRGAVLLAAADAVGPTGRAVGIDLAPEMVELTTAAVAERGLTNATVNAGDAELLSDFTDAEFDVVTFAFAIFFLPDPHAALAEFARVLRPGGTVAVASWSAGDARAGWFSKLREELGIERVSLDSLEPFETPDELRGALERAGFVGPTVTSVPVVIRLTPDEWWRWLWTAAGRATLETLNERDLAALKRTAFERIEGVFADGIVESREEALLAIARRP